MSKKNAQQKIETTAQKVKSMAARGFKPPLIAKRLQLSEEDLVSLYGRELDIAIAEMRAMAGATLFQRAMLSDLAAICFWLKIRAGWSESSHSKSDEPAPVEEGPIFKPDRAPIMPCNARQGCMKATDEQILAGLMRVWPIALEKAQRAGLDISPLTRLQL